MKNPFNEYDTLINGETKSLRDLRREAFSTRLFRLWQKERMHVPEVPVKEERFDFDLRKVKLSQRKTHEKESYDEITFCIEDELIWTERKSIIAT